MEGPGLEKAEGTLWSGVSQWCSGSAKEASGAGRQGEGEAGCGSQRQKGWGKGRRYRTRRGKKHSVMSKKNRKSFKGLNQEAQYLLGWTHGREEGKGSRGDQERGKCVVFRSCGVSEDVERRMKARNS